ncbi:Malolactic regulator [Lacticaseibacillus rhamnosus]|nr:Malolactic regulator [Lacticaseibacillus rhamnosus]MCT3177173.1 Malolactic regulator [Lacticaseibacillus rhamnosus]MCT3184178.1 Malolactic regulator [Lacticaseibacillus rhamnosus]MCT4450234.1 Malolactic regulator [Lacticaseibacillus rhamnosus]
MTRSPAQGSACKDLGRNGQSRAITSEATYTPISKRSCSRSSTSLLSKSRRKVFIME